MRILEDNRAIRVLEERGERRGFQQGIEQGLEQGLEQTARNMLLEGEETAKISRITGLSLSRIIELQNELQSQLQSQ